MRIKHYSQGKFYTFECPKGTRVVRRSDQTSNSKTVVHDHLVVPFQGQILNNPADPPELLPLLAESGTFGVTLVGEPEPDESLAGASCPKCGETDVNWLQLRDGSETIHCDHCGIDFGLPVRPLADSPISDRAGG
jgi:predicted RNA-binding Zn-ribbon protein involved in translation (DUF1610 family)